MELSVQKWGNSAAIRMPIELLGILKVSLGDKLSVNVQPEGVLLKAVRLRYSIAELVEQCDTAAPEPADMASWDNMKPIAREAW